MKWLSTLPTSRAAWALLAFSAIVLEVVALYFQYAMDLAPCIMCIYQRTAVLGVAAAGVLGMINPKNLLIRLGAMVAWGLGSIWGLLIAQEHLNMQTTTDPFAFTCDINPNFPEFMPLHEWLPAFFAATGDCGSIDWSFLGLSMPGWMEVIFAIYAISFVTITLVSFMTVFKSKQ